MKYILNKYGAATGVVLAVDEWEQTQDELRTLQAENAELRETLEKTEAGLSFLRHRGGVRWGSPGIGPESDYDIVIGEARRLLYGKP